jgi:hypothetical protein
MLDLSSSSMLLVFVAAAAFSATAARSPNSKMMTATSAAAPLRLRDLLFPPGLIIADDVESWRSSSSSSPLPLGSCFKVPFSHVRRRPQLLASLLFLQDTGYSEGRKLDC